MEAKNNERGKKCTILKEGELFKKSSVLKKWRARFVVLNREMLCIFRKEEDESNGRTAQNRIFVMDITLLDDYDSKKMKNCFIVLADGRSHIFSCPSDTDRSMWKRMIEVAQESERREEANNPVRIKSIKLTGALKRLMIHRKKGQGLGCTIKNVGGVIFVNRILEEGPVSKTGVLRPGDQIIDINGIAVSNLPVADISEIIKSSPETVVCTVKPVTSDKIYETDLEQNTSEYAVLDLEALNKVIDNGQNEEKPKSKESTSATDEDSMSKNNQRSNSVPERPPKKAVDIPKEDQNLNYADLNFDVAPDPGPRTCVKNDVSQHPQPVKKSPRSKRPVCSKELDKGLQYIQLDFGDKKLKEENGNEQLKLIKNKKQKTPPHEKRTYYAENVSSPV